MYNFDEKGFLIRLLRSTKRIVALKTLKNKRILSASQDKSREFITLIAAIYADELCIPPTLIY
jgi:hypothetical protein